MFRLALLAVLLALTGCAQAQPPFGRIEKYTGRLELPDGSVCSGTRFNTAIITSRHCMEGQSTQVRFQGILVNVTRVWIDGENIYVYTDRNWGPPPRFAKPPAKGEPLYIIGNAAGFEQIDRVGTLSGFTSEALKGVRALLITCGCFHGDSGAGVFNARGELVAVYLGGYNYNVQERNSVSVYSLSIAVPVRHG